jgi:hypothetical protein
LCLCGFFSPLFQTDWKNIYLADSGNHRISKLDPSGTVITIAGAERGFADGPATQARFAEPSGIALDGKGDLIVTDTINSLVRKVDPTQTQNNGALAVTTLAGTGERGSTNGAGNLARFNNPRGIAVLQSSAIIVADTGNHVLRRILLPPAITSIAPNRASAGATITIDGERFGASAYYDDGEQRIRDDELRIRNDERTLQ